jgi:preprotein translocase subunit SecD
MLKTTLPRPIRFFRFALIAALGLGLAACNQLAAFSEPTHYFVLQADMEQLDKLADKGANAEPPIESSLEVISNRLLHTGVTVHRITHEGGGKVIIEASGRDSSAALRAAVGIQGDLAFRMVEMTALPADTIQGIAPPGSEILSMKDSGLPVAIKRFGGINGRHIIDARQGIGQFNGEPMVLLTLDDKGAKKLAKLTSTNVGNAMAIVLDGEVISAPIINEPILGGSLQVSGSFTNDSARDLASALSSGKLPIAFEIVEDRLME